MKHFWTEEDLIEHFTISDEERKLLSKKPSSGKVAFAVLLKFYQYEGRFPSRKVEVPKSVASYIARQTGFSFTDFDRYDWQGRTIKRYRTQIRKFLGFSKWSRRYSNPLIEWLLAKILPEEFKEEQLKETALKHLRELRWSLRKPLRWNGSSIPR